MLTKTGNPSYKLQGIAAGYGFEYKAHSALDDVKVNILVYEKLGLNKSKAEVREGLGF